MAQLLEAKLIAEDLRKEIRSSIAGLTHPPVLASIQVGEDAAAYSYIKSQERLAAALGIVYELHKLPADVTEAHLLDFIHTLNLNKSVHGIILQLPLPQRFCCSKISSAISPLKDVEGIHPQNIGSLICGKAKIVPCTAAAVMALLDTTGIKLAGKEAVVIGHSEIVGKPVALLLLERLATVSICHIATAQAGKLEEHVRRAEILVVAVGKPGVVKGDWVRPGAVVIDVGINCRGDKIVGDVEFEQALTQASYITPVPGGVGPLTVIMLMRNLARQAQLQGATTL